MIIFCAAFAVFDIFDAREPACLSFFAAPLLPDATRFLFALMMRHGALLP